RERRHPTHHDLDRGAADRPIRLTHASGHASVLNSAALATLGIDLAMEEPGGGTIDRELDTGKPSGLLLEMEDWLDRRIPRTDARSMDALMARLSERLLSVRVTPVQDLSYQN